MRGAPHVEFSATIWKISARTSLLTAFRPPVGRALESHFQYSRKPAPCQPTTVRGVTRMRGFFHCAQSLRNPTQNSLCRVVSRIAKTLGAMEEASVADAGQGFRG